MPWNVGDHRRKFLIASGRYLDAHKRLCAGELVFWGEWEPPSRVECRWPKSSDRLPRALHRPHWTVPNTTRFRQNTDPWVWGERMLYSNCKQTTSSSGQPTSMQRLTRGSVICFGSTIDHEFCVDTVFVVASAERWVATHAGDLDVDEAFITCTADSVATGGAKSHHDLTLYRGATVDDPIDGMFSFVPARKADQDTPRFVRPPVRLDGLINPTNRQSTWGSKRPLDVDSVRNAWRVLREQVIQADLVLAVSLEVPERRSRDEPPPVSTRNRC